ncbi:hypothetical protein V8F06_010975 [Rhypophila decipiens]
MEPIFSAHFFPPPAGRSNFHNLQPFSEDSPIPTSLFPRTSQNPHLPPISLRAGRFNFYKFQPSLEELTDIDLSATISSHYQRDLQPQQKSWAAQRNTRRIGIPPQTTRPLLPRGSSMPATPSPSVSPPRTAHLVPYNIGETTATYLFGKAENKQHGHIMSEANALPLHTQLEEALDNGQITIVPANDGDEWKVVVLDRGFAEAYKRLEQLNWTKRS